MSPVLAVDIFDKLNFTGAQVPRFEDIQEEFPRELESSVSFPADTFKPPEKKGETTLMSLVPLGVPILSGGSDPLKSPECALSEPWNKQA